MKAEHKYSQKDKSRINVLLFLLKNMLLDMTNLAVFKSLEVGKNQSELLCVKDNTIVDSAY